LAVDDVYDTDYASRMNSIRKDKYSGPDDRFSQTPDNFVGLFVPTIDIPNTLGKVKDL